jgi:hypothetical protein
MKKEMTYRGQKTNYWIDEVGLVYSRYHKNRTKPLKYLKGRVYIRINGKYTHARFEELMEENWNESRKQRSH